MSIELLTIDEAAQILRVAPVTVRRYVASGRLRALRVGRGIRISMEAVEGLPLPIKQTGRKTPPRKNAKSPIKRGRPTGPDDPLWNIVGMFDGPPTDIATQKDEFLAEAYYGRRDEH